MKTYGEYKEYNRNFLTKQNDFFVNLWISELCVDFSLMF